MTSGIHDTVQIRTQDSAAQQRQGVPNVTDGMTRDGLRASVREYTVSAQGHKRP